MTRILYVEDDEPSRDFLSRRLQLEGLDVEVAENGEQGITMARDLKPDLILMDLDLPVMNGWQATQILKSDPATRSIPVIALTAHAMEGERDQALKAGCDEYESKPVQIKNLLPKLRSLVSLGPSRPVPEVTTETSPTRGSLGKVLVVDDDELSRDMLSRRLALAGYASTVAEDGSRALAAMEEEPFDAVLLDIMMPGLSGLEVLAKIRETHPLTELPVILVSAKDRSEHIAQGLQRGANDYVIKPVDNVVLLARLETHLSVRRLVAERDRLLKLKDEFLRIASHDLRGPLSAIAGFTELLQDIVVHDQPSAEECAPNVDKILQNVGVMNQIIADFLDAQAIEDGQLKLTMTSIALHELAQEVVEANSEYASRKRVSLGHRYDHPVTVTGDRDRLRQVFQNLVGNAVKFGPPDSEVVVTTGRDGDRARLDVVDTGPGLTDQDLEQLFVMYARLSARPTAGEKSSGLGLSICKRLVEMHGGAIGAHNNPGPGATFWVTLPVQSSHE